MLHKKTAHFRLPSVAQKRHVLKLPNGPSPTAYILCAQSMIIIVTTKDMFVVRFNA